MSRACPPIVLALAWLAALSAHAEPPHASYIFPAGGQRGTTASIKVGGHFLHDQCAWEMLGPGVTAAGHLTRGETLWFEGPLIRQPASQQAEDYPRDYAGQVQVAADAPLGKRWWRCTSAQGVTSPLVFVVGDLPEVVEEETDGEAIPVQVALPVTINGRIFPREDSDLWTFDAEAGQSITCAVSARELGSPLVARLEATDASGRVLAESTGAALSDARVRFVAPASGRYGVRIADVAAGGLQHYVYRLTVTAGPWIDHVYPLGGRRGSKVRLDTIGQAIDGGAIELAMPDVTAGLIEQAFETKAGRTNPVRFDVSDLPEELESEPNDTAEHAKAVALPLVLNGRIQVPGDIDAWQVQLTKGKPVVFEVRTARLGSPLLPVLTIRDESGKQLAQADEASAGEGVLSFTFSPPADGKYVVEIRERFARRGGPQFAYRMQAAEPIADVRILVPDALAIDVGTEKKLDVLIERRGVAGQWKTLTLHVDGLPAGVTCEDVQLLPNASKAALTFKCAAGTPVTSANLKIVGRIDGRGTEQLAVWAGQKDGFGHGEPVPCRLAVTLPTPFKFTAEYSFVYAPRGGVLRKPYSIDRGGFAGPLVAQLADRQGRHLQGVTGPVVTVPAGESQFEYPLSLPPWMELGRTSRSNLMLTGELADAAGTRHKVCFTTREQNEQLIAVVTAAAMRISLARKAYAIEPSSELRIPVAIRRDSSVASPVQVELVVPRHMRDIAAEPAIVPADSDQATLVVKLGPAPGPLNMPLVVRATAQRTGDSLVAEEQLELVLP
ncbi:MAG: hypothetical protein L0211_10870 [Planctomycetaceae bacterium]|nr:hypothetical protein [Planctomycetaceae bacterium]